MSRVRIPLPASLKTAVIGCFLLSVCFRSRSDLAELGLTTAGKDAAPRRLPALHLLMKSDAAQGMYEIFLTTCSLPAIERAAQLDPALELYSLAIRPTHIGAAPILTRDFVVVGYARDWR